MDCSTPGFPIHHQLPELAQTHVHPLGDAIQPSHPQSSPSTAFNLSQHQGLFQWAALCSKWPKYWSFNFSISPSKEYSELISFGIDWFDLLAVQRTLKSLLQHHNLKAFNSLALNFFSWSNSHIHTWLLEKPYLWLNWPLSAKWCLRHNKKEFFIWSQRSLLFQTSLLMPVMPSSFCCNGVV